MADALDSKSSGLNTRAGSTPASCTTTNELSHSSLARPADGAYLCRLFTKTYTMGHDGHEFVVASVYEPTATTWWKPHAADDR